MLHNTGPYGPNEAPINMGAPVNVTPISGHMNLAHNINNLNKIAHQSVPASSGHYNLPDYAPYNHSALGMPPQIPQFHNYQQLGFQHSYMNQNANSINDLSWQNGMFPMNLNIQNEHSANVTNYAYDKRLTESANAVKYEDYKEQDMRKMPLNIPQIPNKSYAKNIGEGDDYARSDMYQNTNDNLDLSMKTQEKFHIDVNRRKNIEHTVKLIENILIQSSNKPKEAPQIASDESNSTETDLPSDMTTVNINRSPKNLTKTQKNERLSFKNVQLQSSNNSPDNFIKNVPQVSKMYEPQSSRNIMQTTTDPLALSSEDLPKDSIEKTNENSMDGSIDNKTATEDELSEEEDIKPIVISEKIVPDENMVTTDNSIVIKVEKASWADTECFTPFLKDSNGFQGDEHMSYRVIDGENSVTEATAAYKSEIKPEGVFECPHCSLLFKHPKRFLIHNKWHTFGLTNEKRMEIAKIREQRRFERKEARIIEKLNSTDVTDVKVEGKVFPCKDCDKVFSAKGSLKNHRQRTHPTRVRECKICHKVITSWMALRAHIATHTAESGAGYQCSECPKRFKYSHSLAKHSDTHLEKTHGCPECPKKFGSQNLLKMHMKTHERVLRGATFRCTYCGKGFFESYSLQVHERTHRNERPYVCDICNTAFGTNSSLKRHVKVSHNTAKPYQCSICRRNFSTEAIRDRHELRLHGKPEDFKFPCKQCSCKYLKLKDLQKHVYKMHPKGKRKKKVKSSDSE